MERSQTRTYAIGAEVRPGGVHFRVWAPRRNKLSVVLESRSDSQECIELSPEANGYFSGLVTEASAGSLYRFLLDEEPQPYPDPMSRFQPSGPHGPSQVIDPS